MARVVFSVRNFWYLKFYESVLRELARRGHDVHVTADRGARGQEARWTTAMTALAAEEPRISFGWTPERVGDTYYELGYWLRRWLDYLRFLDRTFDAAPVLRRRAAVRAPRIVRALAAPGGRSITGLAGLLARVTSVADRAVTTGAHLDELFTSPRPDAVIVAPLVTLGSTQYDVLRATRRAGIPTAVSVGSWDHLSSKTLVHPTPDCLIVWNAIQTDEAVRFHGLSRDQVRVTGAQCFDEWFGRAPDRDRETFCRERGVPADAPIVLYVCSALFEGSPSEAEFVKRWVAGLRQSTHDVLRRASVLIRPHPKRAQEWSAVADVHDPAAIVWPRHGEAPLDAAGKGAYFDSLYHSTAIVGLNTSALIEGGILSRPVYTVLLPEFRDNQEGTLHFRHLLEVGGGLLHASRTLDEHYQQLAAGLRDPRTASARNAAFVQTFVRPHGLDRPATDVFADTIEDLIGARDTVRPQREPAWVGVVRGALYPIARALRGSAPDSQRLWREARRHVKQVARERERLTRQRVQRERLRRKRAARDIALAQKRDE